MKKKTRTRGPARGPRTKGITVRCAVCDEPFETTRNDATTCSPKCRKARSRWMAGKYVGEIVKKGTYQENLPIKKKPAKGRSRQK